LGVLLAATKKDTVYGRNGVKQIHRPIDLATKMISRGKAMPRKEKAPLGKSLVA